MTTTDTTPETAAEPIHAAVHTIVEDEHGIPTLTCTALEGADCRIGCRLVLDGEDHCETWLLSGCDHGPLVDSGKCWVAEWINGNGVPDLCADDDLGEDQVDAYRGPVDVEWTGDDYIWTPIIESAEAAR